MLFYVPLVLAVARVAADKSVIVNDADAKIEWIQSSTTNQTCETEDLGAPCDHTWWSGHQVSHFDGDAHFTFGPNTSLQFKFKGCSVGVFGVQLSWSGRGLASVDGGAEAAFDTRSPDDQSHFRQPFYTTSGLDPMKTHTLTVKYDPSQFQEDSSSRVILGIDYLTYGILDPIQSAPGARLPTGSSKGPNIAECVGGLLGGIIGIALAATIFICWRKRRNSARRMSERVMESIDSDHSNDGTLRPWRGSMLPAWQFPEAVSAPVTSPRRMEKKTEPPPYTER